MRKARTDLLKIRKESKKLMPAAIDLKKRVQAVQEKPGITRDPENITRKIINT